MKRDLKSMFPTIVFVLVVAAIFAVNSFVSNKLYNIIPTYKEQPISYKDERQVNISNDSFVYEHLMFDMRDIKFSNPTEQEYKDILVYMLESNRYISLINMIFKEIYWLPRDNEQLFYEIAYGTTDYIQIGTNERGEEKYYIFQGYTEDRGFIEESLVVFSFSIETGIEQFICMDDRRANSERYPKVELDNILKEELVEEAEKYVELITDSRIIEHLPELYFTTEHIAIERNICYIRDSASQLTVYYDTVSDRVIGFRKNRQEE